MSATQGTSNGDEGLSDILVKCHYMSLLDEVQDIGNSDIKQNISKLNNVIDKANQLFPQVYKPNQLYLDAQVMNIAIATLEDTCSTLDVGEGNFRLFTFADQLKLKSLNNEGHPSWEVLAAVAQPVVHNSLPFWSPLHGSFEYETDVPLSQQRKERKPRPQKEQAAEKKEPEKLSSVDKTHEGIEETIRKIYAKLKAYYKQNQKKPISYFKFVINPASFSSTVENIFHVSFLINDGYAKMELGDDDEPVISPISKGGKENKRNPEHDNHNDERLQNIFSIDMKAWKGLVAGMKLTEAMI